MFVFLLLYICVCISSNVPSPGKTSVSEKHTLNQAYLERKSLLIDFHNPDLSEDLESDENTGNP